MKSNFILLLILFLFIDVKYINSKKKKIEKEKEKEKNSSKEEENENEMKDLKNDLRELENEIEEESGPIMTDEAFEEKMYKFLEEKNIKKDKKITKDIVKKIFDEIYSKEFDLPELPKEATQLEPGGPELDPKQESQRFKNEIFDKAARGLDYDDEISIKQVKEYIGPKRIKVAVNEVVENLIGMMGDL